ncbi:MAG: CHAP domain-containing protein [Candidatus Dormibacteria bacterium]
MGLFSVVVMAASLFATGDVGASSLVSQIAQLQSQEASLRSQLASLQGEASSAGQQAAATQQQVATTEAQVAQAEQAFNRANAALATTNAQIAATQVQVVLDRSQLARLVTELYQHDTADNLSSAIANSSGVAQFVANTLQLQTVGQQFSALTQKLVNDENSLQSRKVSQTRQEQQVVGLEASLQSQAADLQSQQVQFSQQASALSGQAGQIASQIQQVSNQIQTLQAEQAAIGNYTGPAGSQGGAVLHVYGPPSPPYASTPDSYPWGQCTWYVATQTEVPWAPFGNGGQWVAEDHAMGSPYPVGMTPRANSMVVFNAGGEYDPYYGHVAWVVAVLGPTTFIVKEANYVGWGEVDEREITSLQGVAGFIYG